MRLTAFLRNTRHCALTAHFILLAVSLVLGPGAWPGRAYATNITENVPLASGAFISPPVAVDDIATTSEDTGLTITVLSNDSDPDNDTLSLTTIGSARHGTTAISGTAAVYTPALNFAGTDSFTYTASDGVLTSTARVTVTVTPQNDAPMVGVSKVLYDGALGGTPDTQGFFYLPVGQASNTWAGGITTLNTFTDTTTQAGYANAIPPVVSVPASFPVLNRAAGYTLRFSAQVISETHPIAFSDRNGDGIGDRAGFNLIAISSDGQRGIELGFWADQIWAQNGGAAEPPPNSHTLFTHGESANFNTTAGLIPYELRVLGDAYSLTVGSTEILSGSLRDYTAFSGSPDVYETPNFIFFGDNTGSAKAIVKLSHISVITNAALPNRTAAGNIPLVIDNLGLMDIDAGGQNVVITLTANSGVLTLTTAAPGGLMAGQISGNGSHTVTATGPLGQINTSLAFTPALIYRSHAGFFGVDTVTAAINDQGHTGNGGALTGQKTFNITVKTSNSGYLPVIVKKSGVTQLKDLPPSNSPHRAYLSP